MKIGSKIRVPVNGGAHESVHATGTIVYVHPAGRFVVVEFDYSSAGRFYGEHWHRKFRESYPLIPSKDKLCSSVPRITFNK